MVCETMLTKNLNRMDARRLGVSLLLGFCVGVMTCIVYMSASTMGQQLSLVNAVWTNPAEESMNDSRISDAGGGHGMEGISPSTNGFVRMEQNSSSTKDNAPPSPTRQLNDSALQFETGSKHEKNADAMVQHRKGETIRSKQPEGTIKTMKAQRKPVCDLSNWRTDVCEMEGDVRIHGKSSSVVLVTDHQSHSSDRKESWRIKPYARKFDKAAMQHIPEVSVRLTSNSLGDVIPRCTVNQSVVPAIVFAISGYTGNYYHDFTDVLIPLFITARQFDREVQFLIATKKFWWISKYEQILKRLSRHEIVYFDGDEQVRCHRRVIVGLHSHKPMSIDPARAPKGYSMVDFTGFMRAAYSLERDAPIRLAGDKKPRLMLIPRKGTRRFTNYEEIVRMAEGSGFEVVVAEAGMKTSIARFVRVVNSCDVMVGVHGAGLTNFVFLPTHAVIIQIVPYGGMGKNSRSCFKNSSEDAGLHYLEYSIGVEESSLVERYPRDHPVIRDPKSIHKLGWQKMGEVYLDNQDVKLDVDRFRPLLLQARELLRG